MSDQQDFEEFTGRRRPTGGADVTEFWFRNSEMKDAAHDGQKETLKDEAFPQVTAVSALRESSAVAQHAPAVSRNSHLYTCCFVVFTCRLSCPVPLYTRMS